MSNRKRSIPVSMDKQTRSAVKQATLDDALRENPYAYRSELYHMWFNLMRAKWAIAHSEGVLLSKQS